MNTKQLQAMKKFEQMYPKPKPRTISMADFLAEQDDEYIRYIFQQAPWESGNDQTRSACIAEYEKRFGQWPAHISKSN